MQYQLPNTSTSMIITLIIIIVKLRNITTTPTETSKEGIKQRENFWIMKLEAQTLRGQNQELN